MAVICFLGILCTGCTSEIDKVTRNLQEKGYVKAMSDKNRTENFNANFLKQTEHTNPISGEIFCADPTAVEYNGRLYVFGTNDHQQFDAVGKDGKNTYEKIQSFVIFSTEDMVNWTYHGTIDVKTVAPWIISSWAPSIVSRVEDDGLTHFYLYFSNNGCGVGVITATDP
ncbi:MAG: family 43 glycosylhydrolase, partial [Oscillospiraceae bacterium]|nr:family 43 glycosylhydrolase [Oscillospiraceae bacterium]